MRDSVVSLFLYVEESTWTAFEGLRGVCSRLHQGREGMQDGTPDKMVGEEANVPARKATLSGPRLEVSCRLSRVQLHEAMNSVLSFAYCRSLGAFPSVSYKLKLTSPSGAHQQRSQQLRIWRTSYAKRCYKRLQCYLFDNLIEVPELSTAWSIRDTLHNDLFGQSSTRALTPYRLNAG